MNQDCLEILLKKHGQNCEQYFFIQHCVIGEPAIRTTLLGTVWLICYTAADDIYKEYISCIGDMSAQNYSSL